MDNTEVDDEYNKTINDVPFTVDDKNKLDGLPTGEELEDIIKENSGGVSEERADEMIGDGISEYHNNMEPLWNAMNDSIRDLQDQMDTIDSALDELHAYAEGLMLPQEVEDKIDEIIDVQNDLMGGDY